MAENNTNKNNADLQNLLLKLIEKHYSIKIDEEEAILPGKLKDFFLGEEKIKIGKESNNIFFWQRLIQYISDNEKFYYRINLPAGKLPQKLAEIAGDGKFIIVWLKIQFEAHHLIEHPLVVAIGEEKATSISPDFFVQHIESISPAKVYFTKPEIDKRFKILKNSLNGFLNSKILQVQDEMFQVLQIEMKRIREYYSHLLAKTGKLEEKERYVHEQQVLEKEHIRKLHPNYLKIVAIPEIAISLEIN